MSYIFYNPNPAGKMVGDCVIRAITRAEEITWEEAFAGVVTEAFYQYDLPSSNYVWGSYLKSKGYVRKNLPDTCPDCYTLKKFSEDYPQGTYIVATGTHAVAVVSGNIWDTWDSSNEIVVYYWEKMEVN